LVVIPTDSASPEQIERYRAFAADRFERTLQTYGPRGMVISPAYVGTSDELADALYAHSGFQRVDEVAFALPFSFAEDDYVQTTTDMATELRPRLGWCPAQPGAHLSDPRAYAVLEHVVRPSDWEAWAPAVAVGHGIGYARYKNASAYCAVVAEVEAVQQVLTPEQIVAAMPT
jgi:hypothetical protein